MEEIQISPDIGSAVVLLYGEATDYVLECAGVSNSHENLPDYRHLDNTTVIRTNMSRVEDLPDTIIDRGLM